MTEHSKYVATDSKPADGLDVATKKDCQRRIF